MLLDENVEGFVRKSARKVVSAFVESLVEDSGRDGDTSSGSGGEVGGETEKKVVAMSISKIVVDIFRC